MLFGASVNIGQENFGEQLTIHQIRQFFLCQNFPAYGILVIAPFESIGAKVVCHML